MHAESISVAVAEAGRQGEVRSLGVVPNRPECVRKLVKKLGARKSLAVCYEAGPSGYELAVRPVGGGLRGGGADFGAGQVRRPGQDGSS